MAPATAAAIHTGALDGIPARRAITVANAAAASIAATVPKPARAATVSASARRVRWTRSSGRMRCTSTETHFGKRREQRETEQPRRES